MKKKLFAFAALSLAGVLLVGCGNANSVNFEKTYWDKNPSDALVTVNEKLTYTVDFIKGTSKEELGGLASALIGNDKLSFALGGEKSTYTAELTTEDGLYVYRTRLVVNGTYTFGENTYEVTGDTVETTVKFKSLKDGFAPVESVRKAVNVIPINSAPAQKEQFVKGGYTVKTTYGGTDARVEFFADEDEESRSIYGELEKKYPLTVKKYSKKAYIDNDISVLLFRTFRYNNSISYTFGSVEPIAGELKTVVGSTVDEGNKPKRTEITLASPRLPEYGSPNTLAFTAQGVKFSTQGDGGQTYMYAYYAIAGKGETEDSENKTRRYPLKIFQRAIHNTGYFVFTLSSAE